MKRRVVVTGLGLLSCLGNDPESFFRNLIDGVSGITEHPDIPKHPVGWIAFNAEEHLSKMELLSLDRVSQFALHASRQALAMARLDKNDIEQAGILYGTGFGGASTLESSYGNFFGIKKCARVLTIPMVMMHAPASQISIHFGIRGECQTYSTACSSSSIAIGEGFRRIQDGYLDVAITGGAECMLLPSVIAEWEKLRVLAPTQGIPSQGCRPFAANRSGFHLAEGAATVILEERAHAIARGAKIVGEIVGYGTSTDGEHITKPSARGQSLAIRRAIAEAHIAPNDIGYINLHGTATQAGDAAEAESIRDVFDGILSKIPVSGTKSSHGHAIGATGAMEFIATLFALDKQVAPPTAFTEEVDPACELNLITGCGKLLNGVRYAASNSFAFGGSNAVLIAKAAD